MKKTLILVLVAILTVQIVSGVSSDLKENYEPKETILAELSGNILSSITAEKVGFYRAGHIRVPVEFEIKKLGEKYFIWAIAPSAGDNYSLRIENISTTFEGNIIDIKYEKNFSVSGNLTDYYISPGFVILSGDFEIEAWLNEDEDKEIVVSFPSGGNKTLEAGINKMKFFEKDFKTAGIIKISIGKYSVPVYAEKGTGGEITPDAEGFAFEPGRIEREINSTDSRVFQIKLVNDRETAIEGINLEYNKNLISITDGRESGFFSTSIPGEDINLEAGGEYNFNISLKEFPESNVTESVFAVYQNSSARFVLEISPFNMSRTVQNLSGNASSLTQNCSNLGGKKCASDESCVGVVKSSSDGVCCIGNCNKTEEPSNAWIGYILIVAAIAVLGFIWYKYRKTKPTNQFARKVEEAERGANIPQRIR